MSDETFRPSYEEIVSDTLGFYPSYLSAIDTSPDYATLAWDETCRVLTAPEAVPAADSIARTTVAEIVPALSDTSRTESEELDDTLRFFSFVVFRLGLAISACRYALDGEQLREAHAHVIDENRVQVVPPLVDEGVRLTLPQSPDITLRHPEDVDGRVAELYDRILTELRTPNVNNIYRALAVEPQFLSTVVETQCDVRNRRPHLENHIRGLFATAIADTGLRPANHRTELRDRGLNKEVIDRVGGQIRAFHENLPTLVLSLVIATILAER